MTKHNPDTNHPTLDQMRAERHEREEELRRLDKQYKIVLTVAITTAALDLIYIGYLLAIVTT